MDSQKYLIAALNKLQLNDSQSAKFLGVSRNAISQYRSGVRIMSAEMAIKVAEVLEQEPLQLILICEKERSKENKRTFWEKQIEMRFAIILTLCFGVITEMTPTPSEAASSFNQGAATVYIMLNKIKRKVRTAAASAYCNFQIFCAPLRFAN